MKKLVLVAGGTGNLGGRIIKSLRQLGAEVRTIVRADEESEKVMRMTGLNVAVYNGEYQDKEFLENACAGVSCVVSALQGLHEVIVDAQIALLNAAIKSGVPRFIPSDYAVDFFKLPDGENRNLDLRREFHKTLDKFPIKSTAILNGSFAEILAYNSPLFDIKNRSISYWENADWKLDFTTMDNGAEFIAHAALDDQTPKFLRIAGFQKSPKELALIAEDALKEKFKLVYLGSRDELRKKNILDRKAHPEGEQDLNASWQSTQYFHSMFSVQLDPLDNNRYPGIKWTGAHEVIINLG